MGKNIGDLRKILSSNLKAARQELRITQVKLAAAAGLSVSYIVDIEGCRTWVSDKTLRCIAEALNMEAYELLLPLKNSETTGQPENKDETMQKTVEMVKAKQNLLRENVNKVLDDLILEFAGLYKKRKTKNCRIKNRV